MFGKSVSQYLRFQGWVLAFIVVTFVVRWVSGSPWASVSVVTVIGLLYYAVAVHLTGFGSYKQLLGLLIIQTALAHLLIIGAIVAAILTGSDNIFTRPEYFEGIDGADAKSWLHVAFHIIAIVILPFFSMLFAAPILFVTRKLKH